MMTLKHWCLTIVFTAITRFATAQPVEIPRHPDRTLEASACFLGYPNAMLFHTAFHGQNTTRYLLLKSSLRSEVVAKWLDLSEEQIKRIENLAPANTQGARGVDPNDSVDEQVVDREYFAFLTELQMKRLDALAIRFDGLSALTRRSLKRELQINDDSHAAICKFVAKMRNDIVLPRFRVNFAATLPNDHEYREVDFAARLHAHTNLSILQFLGEDERKRLHAFLATHSNNEAIIAIENLAPLPQGLSALHELRKK